MNKDDFENVIKRRYSVRSFSDKKLEEDKINKILEAGRIAPTAKNLQPQLIYVITSSKGLDKIDKVSRCRYNAPLVMLVCSNKNIAYNLEDYSTYEMDATIVAVHMMLEATYLDVGSVWVEMFDNKKIKEEFNLDKNIEPICLLCMGYATSDSKPSNMHFTKKDLKDIVRYV